MNSFFPPIRIGRALFLISARGVLPVGLVNRERKFSGPVAVRVCLSFVGETKDGSFEPKERSSTSIEFNV